MELRATRAKGKAAAIPLLPPTPEGGLAAPQDGVLLPLVGRSIRRRRPSRESVFASACARVLEHEIRAAEGRATAPSQHGGDTGSDHGTFGRRLMSGAEGPALAPRPPVSQERWLDAQRWERQFWDRQNVPPPFWKPALRPLLVGEVTEPAMHSGALAGVGRKRRAATAEWSPA